MKQKWLKYSTIKSCKNNNYKRKKLQFFFSTTEAANPTNRKKSFSFLRIKNKSVSLYCKDFHVQLAKM